MFDNELMSDVSFTCGESRCTFHAHKYVLATSSAVFKEFLRFLYTDDCKITAENAIGVFYLAKKYLISSLAEKCFEILQASI